LDLPGGGAAADGLPGICPRVALFISPTLLGIKEPQDFTPAVRDAYVKAVEKLSPGTWDDAPDAMCTCV